MAIVALVAVIGALVTRQVYRHSEANQPPVVLPSGTTPAPPTGQAGAGTVRFTEDADDYPLQDQIRQVLQTYFDAINNRNYAQWSSTVTESRIAEEPEPKWDVDYRSTQDVDIVV